MQKVNSSTFAKLAAITASFALVAASVAIAPAAHAQTSTTTTTTTTGSSMTSAQLMAEIASLQAQLAASQGTTVTGSMSAFTRSLTIGSTGADVTALQTWLISKGFSIPAGATGYFGTQTQAAVAAYQTAHSISPAAGYFGPITMASVNSMMTTGGTTTTTTTTTAGCAPGAMYSSTTGQLCSSTTTTGGTTTLSGGEGTINNFQTVGASNITMGTGASQQVYGFQFAAGGSDLNVNRIYYDVANTNNAGSVRPWNIFQTATLKDGSGNTVATVDATNQANWSQDGSLTSGAGNGNQIYRLSFENVNNVVKMGATQTYYLTLSTQGAFASGNSGGIYSVGLAPQGLRATDALGIQQYTTATTPTTSFVTVNSNSSGSVTLSVGSDNPQTTTIMANQNTTTQNVTLNTFTLNNTGSASVELYTLPVTLLTASSSNGSSIPVSGNISSYLVQSVSLYNGSTLLDTESPITTFTSGGTLTFKNINLTIPAGTTSSFKVTANIQPVGGSNPAPNGMAAQVNVPAAGTVDIETPSGSIITPSGTATGYPISFAVNGISIASAPTSAVGSATLSSGGNGTQQTGNFTFVFNVTAFGQSIYVGSTSAAYSLTIMDQTAGTATSTTNITSGITSTSNRSPLGNWLINSGQTAAFTVNATLSNGGRNHYYYATLNNLVYGTVDTNASSSSAALPSTYTTNAVAISS